MAEQESQACLAQRITVFRVSGPILLHQVCNNIVYVARVCSLAHRTRGALLIQFVRWPIVRVEHY